jgi:hypothetical protein
MTTHDLPALHRRPISPRVPLGTDQFAQAEKVQARLLAVDGGVQTYLTLLRHARKAGKEKVTQDILAAAKKALSESDYKLLEKDKMP